MHILLDDTPCDFVGDSIGKAIAAGAAIAQSQGRMIVEVFVDGERVSADQLGADDIALASAGEVRLISAKPRVLAASVFEDASSALDAAEELQSKAAESIQGGNAANGLTQFNEALSIWISVQQAVEQAAELAEIDLETASPGGISGSEVLARLGGQLSQVREQLRKQDLVGLADSLLYDLPSAVQEWRELLAHLAAEVAED
jgi:hypothetical protein